LVSNIMSRGMNELSDEQLVAEAKNGCLEAFSNLVERHQNKIYQAIRRFVSNHEDAADLTQETWMHAFRSLRSFRREASFSTWVYRIAINLTLNHLKSQKKQKKESLEEQKQRIEADSKQGLSSLAAAEDFELREKVELALTNLPLPYRSAFILVALEGMSHRQAANILGCSENTVSWRMHKARQWLQKNLAPYLLR